MEQPRWDDDAATWRRFAGNLRERIGLARTAAAAAEQRATDAERRATEAEARYMQGARSSARVRATLNRVDRLLHEGDVPGALDALGKHRLRTEMKRRQRRDTGVGGGC